MSCYLVIVDESPAGENALLYSLALASRLAAKVVMLSWRQETLRAAKPVPVFPASGRQALCDHHRLTLPPGRLTDGGELSEAELPNSLQSLLDRHEATLLVVGRDDSHQLRPRRLHAQEAWALLLWRSPCPLLVVPSSCLLRGLPSQLMVTADGLPVQWGWAASAANAWLRECQPAVTVVHVTSPAVDEYWTSVPVANKVQPYHVLLDGLNPVSAQQRYYHSVFKGLLKAVEAAKADLLLFVARAEAFRAPLFSRRDLAAVLLAVQLPILVVGEAP